MIVKKLLVLAPFSMLVACGWVDSTGRESNSTPVTQITFANGQSADATELNEQGSLTFIVSATDTDGQVTRYQWRPDPVAQGDLDQCAGVTSFDREIAVDSLDAACTIADDCAVTFEQLQTASDGVAFGDEVEFTVTAPQLRAPVGVTYQLDAIDNEGGAGSQLSTFCLIAINEAPNAQDDSFTVLEGQVLTVSADSSPNHLLSNDVPDDHVSNEALTVLPQASSVPSLASSFSLQSDGGFTYASSALADRTAPSAVDTFVYSVTDGTHISNATVTVNVLAKNDRPVQIADIPPQLVTAGVEFESDLSTFFIDEEGSTLSFAITAGTLPASGTLSLSAAGVLSGTAELIDEGSYPIEIVASDGSEQVRAELEIEVLTNLPVEAMPIPPQLNELGEVLELELSEYFTDPEGEPLTYTLNSQYTTATIEVDAETGKLEAVFSSVGRFTIDISASDGINTRANIRFVVTVSSNNSAPIFRGTIANRTTRVDLLMNPIVGSNNFSDADNDVLSYAITGTLPAGLTVSTSGVLSGIPTERGTFRGIRFVATDLLGASVTSNAFFIRVSP